MVRGVVLICANEKKDKNRRQVCGNLVVISTCMHFNGNNKLTGNLNYPLMKSIVNMMLKNNTEKLTASDPHQHWW